MNKGNKNQFEQINENKRNNSIKLIKDAAEYLISIGDNLNINNLVKETKRLDPKNKGISEASFHSKKLEHIQTIMQQYGIGKFAGLTINKPNNEIDIDDIIKIVNENKKLHKEINKLKENKNNLQKAHKEISIEIQKLRGKCIELELKNKLMMPNFPANRKY